jgi:hypothetical protein
MNAEVASVAIDTNGKVAAFATAVSDGDLEVFNQEPFAARLGSPGVPTMLETFLFEPAGILVIDLYVPVARVAPTAEVDRFLARLAPDLFNVHVAARDMNGATFVEARTSMVAEGLTMEAFAASLALLGVGAATVASRLHALVTPEGGFGRLPSPASAAPSDPSPAEAGGSIGAPAAFAGYL